MDANILIGLALRAFPEDTSEALWKLVAAGSVGISTITYIEIFAKADLSQEEAQALKQIVAVMQEFPLHRDVAELTIRLRRESKVKMTDCIVAATAMHYQLTVISNDQKDFSRFGGLDWVTATQITQD